MKIITIKNIKICFLLGILLIGCRNTAITDTPLKISPSPTQVNSFKQEPFATNTPGYPPTIADGTSLAYSYSAPVLEPTLSIENTAVPKAIQGDFDLQKALEIIYGEIALSIKEDEIILPSQFKDYNDFYFPNMVASYEEEGLEKYLVITHGGMFPSCHPCQASIDGAIFTKSQNGWDLSLVSRGIVSIGSFSFVPPGQIVKIGPDKYGVLLLSVWSGQGYHSEASVIITEVENELRVVFLTQTLENQLDAITQQTVWGYTSKIDFIPGENLRYYDIQLTQQGTNNEREQVFLTEIYTFSESDKQFVILE